MNQINRNVRICFLTSLLLLSNVPSVVHAQATAPEMSKSKLKVLLGSSSKLGRDNPLVAEFVDKSDANSRGESYPPDKTIPVIKHLKGEGGIPFASQAEYQKAYNERLQARLNDKQYLATVKREAKAPESDYQPTVLKPCVKSSSTVADTGYDGNEERGKKVQFDYLFVHNDDLNGLLNDRHEIFGHKVNIRVVDGGQAGVLATARGFDIQCLPTRVRSTKKFVYRQSGKPALKNYDRDPHGKGVLHPLIKDVADRYK